MLLIHIKPTLQNRTRRKTTINIATKVFKCFYKFLANYKWESRLFVYLSLAQVGKEIIEERDNTVACFSRLIPKKYIMNNEVSVGHRAK